MIAMVIIASLAFATRRGETIGRIALRIAIDMATQHRHKEA
jgi:hypothetical protein